MPSEEEPDQRIVLWPRSAYQGMGDGGAGSAIKPALRAYIERVRREAVGEVDTED